MAANATVRMGTLPPSWGEDQAKTITFTVTEDCNLACKYCYMTGKNKKNKMSWEVAKHAVDYILQNRTYFNDKAVIWDFIGGEPFLEIDLIDAITEYVKQQMFLLDHPWFNAYRLSFSTNGLLYNTPKVQDYIRRNRDHLSIGISIDGNKTKHDMQRVWPDGRGSYDDVVKNIPLWMEQFPESGTKSTFAHDDLPYLKDSIIHLWGLGVKAVAANVVFENVWHEGDDVVFENQLRELADYVLANKLWDEYTVRFFDPKIGFPNTKEALYRNYCGTGQMLSIDYKGDLYPCVRFCEYSLNGRKGYCIGNIYDGIDEDKLRPFEALTLTAQSKEECVTCEVASGCAWCSGCNYDCAESDTIYERAIFNCKMHKANIRAIEYFWGRYTEITGLRSPRDEARPKPAATEPGEAETEYLYLITSDDITPHCAYRPTGDAKERMPADVRRRGIAFAKQHNMVPILLGDTAAGPKIEDGPAVFSVDLAGEDGSSITFGVYDNEVNGQLPGIDNTILLIDREHVRGIFPLVEKLSTQHHRINLVLEDIHRWNEGDVQAYQAELDKLCTMIVENHREGKELEINVLTDILNLKAMCNCDAGESAICLAPNGKFYICPAFYFADPTDSIGSLDEGVQIKSKQLLRLDKAPICSVCDAYHCKRCKYLNMKMTGEINTPSKIQCRISHCERAASKEMQRILQNGYHLEFANVLADSPYTDPLEKLKAIRKGGN